MKIPALIAFLLLLCVGLETNAQTSDSSNDLYRIDRVPKIEITIHPDSLDEIFKHPHSNREYKATFTFSNNSEADTITDIGFRLRGNTSRDAAKKSFKVSFNTFIKGGKYKGVEKMNLNGEHNDPSSSRAMLYWFLAQKTGIIAPRANHVELYINGEYFGLYTNVEHIDEEFVEDRFGNKDGNLYKCLYPADLTYQGYHQDFYKFRNGDYRVYELKTNEEKDDYSDLAHFIDVLNNVKATELPCQLEALFNVQNYLKIAALDVLTGNWDGYIFNRNNFYLYNNTASGLIEYIPYDVDNTFGIDWFSINWATRNIYNWNGNETRPLYRRLLSIPAYKAQYTFYLKEIMELISGKEFQDYMNHIKVQARPYLVEDPFYPLDYGFTINAYDQSWVNGFGAHVPVGIVPYLDERLSTAGSQCSNTNPFPMISNAGHMEVGSEGMLRISAEVKDIDLNEVKLGYSLNGAFIQYTEMNDSGTAGDVKAADNVYTATLNGLPSKTVVEYIIYANDLNQDESVKPCTPLKYIMKQGSVHEGLTVWPNPATGNNIYFSEEIQPDLYDHTGRLIRSAPRGKSADISNLNSGMYLIKTDQGKSLRVMIIH